MVFGRAFLCGVALSALASDAGGGADYGSPAAGRTGSICAAKAAGTIRTIPPATPRTASSSPRSRKRAISSAAPVGYKFDQLRLELGLDFSNSDAKSISLNNAPSSNVSGGIQNTAGMVNALWDSARHGLRALYRMGVGVSSVSLNNLSRNGALMSNDSDLVFAYQPMAGVNYHSPTSWHLACNTAYFATVDPSFKLPGVAPGSASGTRAIMCCWD